MLMVRSTCVFFGGLDQRRRVQQTAFHSTALSAEKKEKKGAAANFFDAKN
jgi:hypothetical protein